MVFDRSLQSHLEFSEFYQLEVSRPPDPETFTGPARVVASLLASQNPFGGWWFLLPASGTFCGSAGNSGEVARIICVVLIGGKQ